MLKSIYTGGILWGLAALLIACGGSSADPPPPHTEAQPTAAVDVAPEEVAVETPTVVTEVAPPEDVAADAPAATEQAAMSADAAPAAEAAAPEDPAEETAAGPESEPADASPQTPPGPSPEQQAVLDGLEVIGAPPELSNEIWLNSDPLKLADLRGKVVIVEFWTYG